LFTEGTNAAKAQQVNTESTDLHTDLSFIIYTHWQHCMRRVCYCLDIRQLKEDEEGTRSRIPSVLAKKPKRNFFSK
jgi:hypothetical protein